MLYDLSKIKEELNLLPEYETQIYLQGKEKGIDPIEPVKGRAWEEIDKEESLWDVNLFDIPYLNSILDAQNLCRTRIMKTRPKTLTVVPGA